MHAVIRVEFNKHKGESVTRGVTRNMCLAGGLVWGGVNQASIESGVPLWVRKQEWQLRLSAAVGLREHWQERSGSSSRPSLTHSTLLPLGSSLPL